MTGPDLTILAPEPPREMRRWLRGLANKVAAQAAVQRLDLLSSVYLAGVYHGAMLAREGASPEIGD